MMPLPRTGLAAEEAPGAAGEAAELTPAATLLAEDADAAGVERAPAMPAVAGALNASAGFSGSPPMH